MNWLDDLKIEDLPDVCREIVQILQDDFPGIPHIPIVMKIAAHYNKQGIYFAYIDELIEKKKKEYIHKNYDGKNIKQLCRATGYSERWVYEILKGGKDDRQAEMF